MKPRAQYALQFYCSEPNGNANANEDLARYGGVGGVSICLINGFLYVTLQVGGGCSRWVLRCEGIMRILSCRGLNARRCCHGKRDRVKLVKPLRARTREATKNRQRTIQRHLGFTVLELGRSARSNIPKINDSHAHAHTEETHLNDRLVGPFFTRTVLPVSTLRSLVCSRAFFVELVETPANNVKPVRH